LGNAAGQGWITNVSLDRVFSFWNGGYGVKVGSTFTGHRLENISIDGAELENNGGPGVGLVGANIQGFSLTNSIVQWNNVAAANPEIQITSTSVSGCRIQSNYIEGAIAGTGSQSNNWITPNVTSCVTHPNYLNGFGSTANAGLSASWLTQSTPGTFASLPACSATYEGTTAAITDSSTATFGATITGGGANHVLGYCNGTNWTVMGE
ncbi:MAG TPA: hypothetical protein VFZ27_01295, partial [Terriglobia bacterium]|nr:hypothetical protein [Terriglobia bacterium]